MSKQLTAVDLIIQKIEEHIIQSVRGELGTNRGSDFRIGLRKAIDICSDFKEMEREQIIKARQNGLDNGGNGNWDSNFYYNETYGSK